MKRRKDLAIADKSLIRDVRDMIEEARASVAATVNTGLTMLYWRIGRRINQDILKEGRAEYGEAIVSTLSRQLQVEYGRGFSAKNLRHMIHFAEVFADEAIVSTLWRQLSSQVCVGTPLPFIDLGVLCINRTNVSDLQIRMQT